MRPATYPFRVSETEPYFPWGRGAATGVGSMPGDDAREAAKAVLGTFEALPHLPELPARGPGADMPGRTAGLLAELYVQAEPSGWRLADRPGRDTRRARSWLGEDLDALEEFAGEHTGALKVQAVGPWTLAAALQRRNGEAMLGDAGACRDLAASLREGLAAHLAEVARRVPQARLVLQLDEPSLPRVLGGRVPTASGYRRYAPVEGTVAESALRDLVSGLAADAHAHLPVIFHCCAPGAPFGLLRRAGATGFSFDAAQLAGERGAADEAREAEDTALGEAVEDGLALFAGVVPGAVSDAAELSDPASSVSGVRSLWRRLGLAPGLLSESVVVTPACGLAGSAPAAARAVLAHCVRAAGSLADDPE